MENNEERKDTNRELLIRLREETGMSRKEFSEYFQVPYRTLQDWELGNRTMPDYLLRLMMYKANRRYFLAYEAKGSDGRRHWRRTNQNGNHGGVSGMC